MSLRWGSASRRLCLGADPLVFRSPVTSSWADGAGLVHVGSVDPREPHRRPVRWGSPNRLPRFGNRVCAAGHVGDDHLDMRLHKHGGRARTQCRCFVTLALYLTWGEGQPGAKGRKKSATQREQVNILITKRSILRAIGKRDPDGNPREGGDARTPRWWHEPRTWHQQPHPQRHPRQAVTRARTRGRATGHRAHEQRSKTQDGTTGKRKCPWGSRRAQRRHGNDGTAPGSRHPSRESEN